MYSKTTYPPHESSFKINPGQGIYTCGSCFAEELKNRLSDRKFKITTHPFGIVFNPMSIARQFSLMLSIRQFRKDELVYQNEIYHSMDHHGSYSNSDPDTALKGINKTLQKAVLELKKASFLVLTLGSAHYYTLNSNQQVVANCHKLPAGHFSKKRADTKEMILVLEQSFENLYKLNPELKIIVSISPVRYLKDGFIENNRSKAALILTADYLCSKLSYVHYFPAYEIFMDDLRDYRYVNEDLVHPSNPAINYIWNYFQSAYFSESSKQLMTQLNSFHQLLAHRVLNKESSEFKAYQLKIQKELNVLETNFSEIDFTEEKNKIIKLFQ